MHHPVASSIKCDSPPSRPGPSPWRRRGAVRELTSYDAVLVSFMLWAFVHTSEALAADAVAVVGANLAKPDFEVQRAPVAFPAWTLPLQSEDAWLRVPDPTPAANTEFRPRGASVLTPPSLDFAGDDFQHDSLWQRLGQFRTRNRLCLLTLWQTGGSSLSLQAGRKGDPTLQWTSRMTRHDGVPGGLFDELFATSTGGAFGKGLRFFSRGAPVDASSKPSKPSSDALLPAAATSK